MLRPLPWHFRPDAHAPKATPAMTRDTFLPLALAAGFTLGCVGIQSARRHPDAVTLVLVLLLGLVASAYVGRLSQLQPPHASATAHRREVSTGTRMHPDDSAPRPRCPLPNHRLQSFRRPNLQRTAANLQLQGRLRRQERPPAR